MIWQEALTDFHNTADTGRIMTAVVLCAMIILQAMSTWMSPTHEFNAQNFGIGCGAVIGALAAYIYGDAKGQQMTIPPGGNPVVTVEDESLFTITNPDFFTAQHHTLNLWANNTGLSLGQDVEISVRPHRDHATRPYCKSPESRTIPNYDKTMMP